MKCPWIENRISIETDGWTRPCCLETDDRARISHIRHGIQNAFEHHKLLDLRNNLSSGFSPLTKPYCNRCEVLESRNQGSMRTGTKYLSETRELKSIQFKLSNRCQLACGHCGSDRSSTWAKINGESRHVKIAFKLTDEFIEELISLLPNIEILKFSGGEPFLDPEHWRLLERLKHLDRSHCEIQYITNGLVRPRKDLWDGWREIKCSVSVDGFEDSYEWFRRGSSWSDLVKNVKLLEEISVVSMNYSITPYTFKDFIKSKNFWKFDIITFPIVYPHHCNMFHFPKRFVTNIDGWETIPHLNCSDSDEHLHIFRDWAIRSDQQWGTIGAAEKIYDWMIG